MSASVPVSSRKKAASKSATKATAAKAQALVLQAKTVLATRGEPLTAKGRKEVMGLSLHAIPAFVSAAASAYEEHAALLGGDLDASAALDAMDFVTENAPVLASLRDVTQSLEDRVFASKAASAKFALTVYDRMRANASLPQGAVVQSRLTAMEALVPRRKRKAAVKDEGAAPEASPATEATPAKA